MIPDQFDQPLFKKLANNDTGSSKGHQGGIVIPKKIEHYFPFLDVPEGPANPTADRHVRAVLVVGNEQVGLVDTRYQYQTWTGTRLERRLTGNLGPLRNKAAGGDYLLIERGLDDPDFYRLTLRCVDREGEDQENPTSRPLPNQRTRAQEPSVHPVDGGDRANRSLSFLSRWQQRGTNPKVLGRL